MEVMYWIIWDLASVMKDLDTAPPIQSRMYQAHLRPLKSLLEWRGAVERHARL